MPKHVLGLGLLLAVWAAPAFSSSPDKASVDERRKELSRLLAEEWEYDMRESPESATVIGGYRYIRTRIQITAASPPELLRAVRLVLDTGVHYKHWTRQQMIDFFHQHTSEDEPDVLSR